MAQLPKQHSPMMVRLFEAPTSQHPTSPRRNRNSGTKEPAKPLSGRNQEEQKGDHKRTPKKNSARPKIAHPSP